jgi:hypothetical protein
MRLITAFLALLYMMPAAAQPSEYSQLFERVKPGLFTVEVVDRVSNNKNAQGSAFAVDENGVLATNYHVVSEYVLDPERYALRFRDSEGRTGPLDVVAVDVLHDLALVRLDPDARPGGESPAFELAAAMPQVGETVLALGNPYDIGISIVPGTYNGLLENQYRKNIHFTGALNPGMSGGPAVDTEGRVIGINVAGAGNSVSFLVPVSNLRALLSEDRERAPSLAALRERVVNRILEHQAGMIDDLLAGDWALEAFGPLMIPREIRPWLSCSGGGSDADSETPWTDSHSNCTLNDRIYLSRSLDTGPLEIIFGWYASDELNAFQFANVFEQNTFVPFNRTGDDDVTEFECREDWVRYAALEPVPFKATYCLRAYLDYPGLHDVLFIGRALMPGSEALHVHYTLAGVGRESARAFHQRLLGALRWK